MDASRIKAIKDLDSLTDLVSQLENLPSLTAQDIGPLVLPLARRTATLPGERFAKLTERILLLCLSRLPPPVDHPVEEGTTTDHSNLPYPTSSLYNIAMVAWGGLGTSAGAKRAERIFQLMKSEYVREKDDYREINNNSSSKGPALVETRSPAPNWRSYKNLIRAWVMSDSKSGPFRAYELLKELERESGIVQLLDGRAKSIQQITGTTIGVPDRAIYNMVMSAYSKMQVVQHPIGLERVKVVAKRMERLVEITGDDRYSLDSVSLHSILRAYSRYVDYVPYDPHSPLDAKYATEIETVVEQYVVIRQPDKDMKVSTVSWAYGVLVDALIKSKPWVQSLHKANSVVFGLAGQPGWMRMPIRVGETEWPRHDTLIRLVKAWDRAAVSAEEKQPIIDALLHLAATAPHEQTTMLNVGMEEWVNSGYSAPHVVETMLYRALENRSFRQTVGGESFAVVLKAWMRSRSENAPYRAELVLRKLLELYESRGQKSAPREVHLRYVITTWISRCSDARRYEGLAGTLYPAEHVEHLVLWFCRKLKNKNVVGTFAMALRAWSTQVVPDGPNEPNIVQRATSLLNKLEEAQGNLPPYPCNWVLETCRRPQATSERRLESTHAAIDTFKRGERNARSFVLLIQVLKAQLETLDEDVIKMVEGLFQECCSLGMLTQEMVGEVAGMLPPESLQRLFGESNQNASSIALAQNESIEGQGFVVWNGRSPSALLVENLPASWSCVGSLARNIK
jgi:hypothetical protein